MKSRGVLVAVVVVAFIILINLAAWLLGPGVEKDVASGGSTFSNSPTGLRGLALFYEHYGIEHAQRRQSFEDTSDLSADHDVLIIACPETEYSEREIEGLKKWVGSGGRLILIEPAREVGESVAPGIEWTMRAAEVDSEDRSASRNSTRDGACAIPLTKEKTPLVEESSRPVSVSPLTSGVTEVVMPAPAVFSRLGEAVPSVTNGRDVTVAVVAVGRGELVLLSTNALSNATLAAGENAQLALNLARGKRAVFDEYHHGFRQSGGALLAMPVQWRLALAALLIAVLAYAWAKAPRRSPPAQDPPVLPRTRGEFISALGRSLERADGSQAAVRVLQDDIRRRLRRQFFVRGAVTDQGLISAAAAAGVDPRLVAAALAPIDPDNSAFVHRARLIAALRKEL